MYSFLLLYICCCTVFYRMPPRKRSLAGSLNYSKRKDARSTGEDDELCIYSAEEVGSREIIGSGEGGVGSGEGGVGSG